MTRIIKKYTNRRLYDTQESKYIALEDVRRLVLDNVDFCVIEKESGEEITRNILLQIILEQEEDGKPIFNANMLKNIIRFYGDTVQNLAADYIEQSLSLLSEQQKMFQSQVRETMTANPLLKITDLTQQNLKLWHKMQNDFFSMVTSAHSPLQKGDKTDSQE